MSLGKNLFNARKNKGLTQDEVSEKAGVSRQTISKWETDETLPDINQAKKLAVLYGVTLDELTDCDEETKQIERIIENTDERINDKVDWNKVWSKKYPVLSLYKDTVNAEKYSCAIREMLESLMKDYGYGNRDACLVLKDILYCTWKEMSAQQKKK